MIDLGSISVTQEEMLAFARQFDPQPFHVDPERAKTSIFGTLVASGWHTGSLFMRLLCDHLLNDTVSMASPGLDEIRWRKPVFPGDTLRAQLTVAECTLSRSRPNMGIMRSRCEMFNQHDEMVLSFMGIHFFGRKLA